MGSSASFTLHREGSDLHVWLSGPSDGPLIALSHGASMDHRLFDDQLGPLTDAGYRVLAWDVRGHGLSQPIGTPPDTVTDVADDLLAILEHLGVSWPICVGGQSLGGYIAQDLLYRFPERFTAIVVIGSTCITMPIPWWERWALRASPRLFALWPWEHLKGTVAQATALRPAVRDYARSASDAMSRQDFLRIWSAVARSIRPDHSYRIEVPLLLTHGAQDRTGNVARTAPAWAARDPLCRYEVIPDASHNANQDNPEHFNAVLLEFLEAHYPVR